MQEILGIVLMVMIFGGVGLAAAYIWILTRFFEELREKEPEVWKKIGAPTLANILLKPERGSKKFYAFFPVLKARRKSDYKYAGRAYFLFCAGLGYFVFLVLMCLAMVLIT